MIAPENALHERSEDTYAWQDRADVCRTIAAKLARQAIDSCSGCLYSEFQVQRN